LRTIIIVIAAVAIGVVAALLRTRSSRKKSPSEVSRGLRHQALTLAPTELGISVVGQQPFLILMEMAYPSAVASVLSTASGEASIYFSSGGGIIGGAGHESVRQAAVAFVAESAKHAANMTAASDFPYPGTGNVRFYIRTPQNVLASIEVPETQLGNGEHALSPLYFAGQNVITRLRELTPSKPN
jgi:hypothetical protein